MKPTSIGQNKAKQLYASRWWLDKTPREIVGFQLFVSEMACPIGVFIKAMEDCLHRPFLLREWRDLDALLEELTDSPKPPVNLANVIKSLPVDYQVLVQGVSKNNLQLNKKLV